VWVRLDFRRQLVSAVVEDNGRGFDADPATTGESSYGIMGMQERLALLGGELNIKSQPGKGTRVFIKVPLK
jgi:two-component system sensor histidine kinase DegS